ncbi:unnamed protein product [Tetraodon nigroviridis]|uniref:SH3 domain-binding glutamic acid-rich-like protein n=1 Tax=Tetraodon nigroviridis TaxID=99883 RepID=Q4RR82_TETNG|nr:unnamed protein product [Tetraodon nigroviridis]
MVVTVFYSSVSGSLEVKKSQQRIIDILEGKNIPYKLVDIAQNSEDKQLMRKLAGNSAALPPQVCNGDDYCGDYEAFDNANEVGTIKQFLKLK